MVDNVKFLLTRLFIIQYILRRHFLLLSYNSRQNHWIIGRLKQNVIHFNALRNVPVFHQIEDTFVLTMSLSYILQMCSICAELSSDAESGALCNVPTGVDCSWLEETPHVPSLRLEIMLNPLSSMYTRISSLFPFVYY